MKHLIEVEIPDGEFCEKGYGQPREAPEFQCRFLNNGAAYEYQPYCQHPEAPRDDIEGQQLGGKSAAADRSKWCHDKYDPGPDIAIGSCRRNRDRGKTQ